MKKMKIIIGVVVLIIVVEIAMIWHRRSDYNFIMTFNWGIALPYKSHYTETYEADSGPSFHGDGTRYHVYYCENAEAIDNWQLWRAESKSIHYESYSIAVSKWLDEIDVPSEKRPEYSECVFWYNAHMDTSEIIVLWNRTEKTVYVVEHFI